MEQYAYLLGILISGLVAGLGVKASKGDTVEEREKKLIEEKTKRHSSAEKSSRNDDIFSASIETTHLLARQQVGFWERFQALEEKSEKREKDLILLVEKDKEREASLAELRQKVTKLQAESEQKDTQISSLERKVAVLRQKLKESGINITDEELEAEIASADTIIR